MVGMLRPPPMQLSEALANSFPRFFLLPFLYLNAVWGMVLISIWLGEIPFLDHFPCFYCLSTFPNAVIFLFVQVEHSNVSWNFHSKEFEWHGDFQIACFDEFA